MKPRSIVFTLYGDYLRYCGAGEAPLSGLTELLSLFEVEPATSRMVMSRLRSEGWFVSRRHGRQTTYLLSESGFKLLDEGRERIFRHDPYHWGGSWTMVTTRTGDRTARDELRRSLTWLGFGLLQPAVWLAPGDRRDAARAAIPEGSDVSADVFLTRTDDLEHDRGLAGRCWDLNAINLEYQRFFRKHDRPTDTLGDERALIRSVELTDDYRRFPFTDPDLPSELLPADWSGWRAHRLFAEMHNELCERAEAAVGRIVGLPVVDAYRVRVDNGLLAFTQGAGGSRQPRASSPSLRG